MEQSVVTGKEVHEKLPEDARQKQAGQEEARSSADRRKTDEELRGFVSVRSHHTPRATSYFVHLLRQQFVEMAHTRPHGPGHSALVFFLLLDQEVVGALVPLPPAPRVEARIHPAAGSQSASEQKGLFLSLHTQQPAAFGLAGLRNLWGCTINWLVSVTFGSDSIPLHAAPLCLLPSVFAR